MCWCRMKDWILGGALFVSIVRESPIGLTWKKETCTGSGGSDDFLTDSSVLTMFALLLRNNRDY